MRWSKYYSGRVVGEVLSAEGIPGVVRSQKGKNAV